MGAREGVAYPSLFLCAGDKIGKAFPLFMTAVNPPAQWVTDQVLDPLADVDLVNLSADLTEGYPTSAPPSATVGGASATDTVSTKSTKSKK